MREEWRDIEGFSGYQVSNKGRVRTFRKRKHYPEGYGTYWYISDEPTIMSQSDDGNGYMKLMLYGDDGRRYCKKVHRLVAEAFIPNNDPSNDTVDYIQSGSEGKLDNSVRNLRWISRRENIQKAYRDGMCDRRINRNSVPIMGTDLWTGEELYFKSINEAARYIHRDASSIHKVLRGELDRVSHYYFDYAGREEILCYGIDDEYQLPWV